MTELRESLILIFATFVVVTLIVLAAIGVGALAGPGSTPTCFEDEAVLWDGDEHTVCVPLDNLTGG